MEDYNPQQQQEMFEYEEDDALYGEMKRLILQLTADEDEEEEEVTQKITERHMFGGWPTPEIQRRGTGVFIPQVILLQSRNNRARRRRRDRKPRQHKK
ncbi:hypothetical protein M569_12051 [Genlisea aurea]|uniref:Uncharacterized protein n=1 Tax=Genlisea aurea TaxID=192259 RepID=S8C7H8_9LAMI|nr:hypothetical protein M569_12051 [Genlisea aurea]